MRLARYISHTFAFFLTCYFLLVTFNFPAHAQEEFDVSYDTTYTLSPDGTADVIQEITLTNSFSKVYATSYRLILEGKKPDNIKSLQDGEVLPIEVIEEEKGVKIDISFPDALVGRGKSRTFIVSYTLPKVVIQNGRVWDATIPKLASPENIDTYTLTLRVPVEFGNPAYISPEPIRKTTSSDFQNFVFQKNNLVKAGVVAAFGEFQVFSFTLNYHLQNPLSSLGETEIALPPDTAFQRVFYDDITPRPEDVRLDGDGNWLAAYKLKGGERLDVIAQGRVQVFAEPQDHYSKTRLPTFSSDLAETKYWQVTDPQIRSVATSLVEPRAIYDFVTNYLTYDYSRVREGIERLGAKAALENPSSAICMEFTDLFITLSRAAGIPAREVNGYAHTENPEIQPLSLVADVLHAWPEYWDNELGVWKAVDPTWESTTGGVDFFDKFDLAHITFAIHGEDPNLPLPAGSYKSGINPQKDVQVQFGRLPDTRIAKPEVDIVMPKSILPFLGSQGEVKIYNPGPTALYDIPVNTKMSGLKVSDSNVENIDFLAPFDQRTFTFRLTSSLFAINNEQKMEVLVGNDIFEYNVPVQERRITLAATIFGFLLLVIMLSIGIWVLYGSKRRIKAFLGRNTDQTVV